MIRKHILPTTKYVKKSFLLFLSSLLVTFIYSGTPQQQVRGRDLNSSSNKIKSSLVRAREQSEISDGKLWQQLKEASMAQDYEGFKAIVNNSNFGSVDIKEL
jgi:hypothetical protein